MILIDWPKKLERCKGVSDLAHTYTSHGQRGYVFSYRPFEPTYGPTILSISIISQPKSKHFWKPVLYENEAARESLIDFIKYQAVFLHTTWISWRKWGNWLLLLKVHLGEPPMPFYMIGPSPNSVVIWLVIKSKLLSLDFFLLLGFFGFCHSCFGYRYWRSLYRFQYIYYSSIYTCYTDFNLF